VSSDFVTLDVPTDMTLNDVKSLIEAELSVPRASQGLSRNNQPLVDSSKTLQELNIAEGDLLGLTIRTRPRGIQNRAPNPAQLSGANADTERIRLHMLGDERFMQRVRQENPRLADAASDPTRFQSAWQDENSRIKEQQAEQERQYRLLESDPFNAEAQRKIEKLIQDQQIAINIEKAMEENPESFARVSMLYIDVTVNNVPIKAFVDSGAQTTIMSPDAAERCHITHLIDTRWGGMARGVGTAKIIGRVHHAYLQLGQFQAASSFTVMEGKDVDLLLGLDMLKKHQMCIDLSQNCLKVQGDQIPFLPEHEIPKMMDEVLESEPKVVGPGGATIGAKTGTVEPPSQASGSGADAGPSGSRPPSAQTAGKAPEPVSFGQPQPVTEQTIKQVTEMGFSREEAVLALQQADGNVDIALSFLMEL
jgi:DNA damage-inducible protein 1